MPRHVVLVDPYSEAAEYANAFRARGVESVAVLSTPAPLKSYLHGWKPEAFAATHFYDGDFAKLVETVRSYDPVAVIPGNEHAVMLVDRLVEELTPERETTPRSLPPAATSGRCSRPWRGPASRICAPTPPRPRRLRGSGCGKRP